MKQPLSYWLWVFDGVWTWAVCCGWSFDACVLYGQARAGTMVAAARLPPINRAMIFERMMNLR